MNEWEEGEGGKGRGQNFAISELKRKSIAHLFQLPKQIH